MKEVVSRCDICDSTEEVFTYRITREGVDGLRQDYEIDLCQKVDSKHRQPMHSFLDRHARQKAQAVSTAGGALLPPERADRDLKRLQKRVRNLPPLPQYRPTSADVAG